MPFEDPAMPEPGVMVVPVIPEPGVMVVPVVPEPGVMVVPVIPEPGVMVVPVIPEPGVTVVPAIPEPGIAAPFPLWVSCVVPLLCEWWPPFANAATGADMAPMMAIALIKA